MLKLMLHYFSHLMGITNSLEKILVLGRIAGKKRRWEQRMGWLDSIINWMDINFTFLFVVLVTKSFLTVTPWTIAL